MSHYLRYLRLAVIFNILLTFVCSPAFADYFLVWSDEFSGTELDTTKWNYKTSANGNANNELQYYTERNENVKVEDGFLKN